MSNTPKRENENQPDATPRKSAEMGDLPLSKEKEEAVSGGLISSISTSPTLSPTLPSGSLLGGLITKPSLKDTECTTGLLTTCSVTKTKYESWCPC